MQIRVDEPPRNYVIGALLISATLLWLALRLDLLPALLAGLLVFEMVHVLTVLVRYAPLGKLLKRIDGVRKAHEVQQRKVKLPALNRLYAGRLPVVRTLLGRLKRPFKSKDFLAGFALGDK